MTLHFHYLVLRTVPPVHKGEITSTLKDFPHEHKNNGRGVISVNDAEYCAKLRKSSHMQQGRAVTENV